MCLSHKKKERRIKMSGDNKLRQVTDIVHGTIFLSELEAELIATPFFFRLHDIYQSSTVYMTYPSNRTKRYEHSLGVMQLASRMIFASVTNADDETKSAFFIQLEERFNNVISIAEKSNDYNITSGYYEKVRELINRAFTTKRKMNDIWDSLSKAKGSSDNDGLFSELAINHYQYFPMISKNTSDREGLKQYFLYRCLLQALRIVALFHDVGHPPFSHIIEETLKDIYAESDRKNWNPEKLEVLDSSIRPYASEKEEEAFTCQSITLNKSLAKAATHERIGFCLLQNALIDAIQNIVEPLSTAKGNLANNDTARSLLIYLVVVAEFSLSIWAEKDIFFKTMHTLVDGIIDADRLDYIVRDSINSGVDWGMIPYDRIITPMKLMRKKDNNGGSPDEQDVPLIIAFPKKIEEDIIDILLIRYKLFARVNYHHRCMKTAKALQTAVKILAENYLKDNEDSVNQGISSLWKALSLEAGDQSIRIIQWNDSFLITTLHQALVELQDSAKYDKDELRILSDNLREILLNKKKYYSVIKRGQDCKAFIDLVFSKAGITKSEIEQYKQQEFCRFCHNRSVPHPVFSEDEIATLQEANECDSVKRARIILELMETGDLEQFDALGMDESYIIMEFTLELLKEEGKIKDYHLIKNTGRRKTGIQRHKDIHDEIYLYDTSGAVTPINEEISLKPQIKTIEKSIPWIYVYIVPNDDYSDSNGNNKSATYKVFEALAEALAEEINKNISKLFSLTTK